MPIVGEEHFTAQNPAFVWYGKVKPLPFFWINARDRYYQDKGNVLIKLLSIFTIADPNPKEKELYQSSLVHFISEHCGILLL